MISFIIFWLGCISVAAYFHMKEIKDPDMSCYKSLIHISYICFYGCFLIAGIGYYMHLVDSALVMQHINNMSK